MRSFAKDCFGGGIRNRTDVITNYFCVLMYRNRAALPVMSLLIIQVRRANMKIDETEHRTISEID